MKIYDINVVKLINTRNTPKAFHKKDNIICSAPNLRRGNPCFGCVLISKNVIYIIEYLNNYN